MLYSMTGYGRGEHGATGIRVNVRAVNHKALDMKVALPSQLAGLEVEIVRWVRDHVGRGRLDVRVDLDEAAQGSSQLDSNVAMAAHRDLEALRVRLGVERPVSLGDVLRSPNVWRTSAAPDEERLMGPVMEALSAAVEGLHESRQREGETIRADLERYLAELGRLLSRAREIAPERVEDYRRRLEERLAELTVGRGDLDADRLALEVAMFADRVDVGEELARAEAHIDELCRLLAEQRGPQDRVGKRLDFFLQELSREVNTLSSKSRDSELTRLGIDMKSALESMREQVANVQ